MRNRDGKEAGRIVERAFQERRFIWRVVCAETRTFCDIEIGEVRLDREAIGIAKSICAHSRVDVRIAYHFRSRLINCISHDRMSTINSMIPHWNASYFALRGTLGTSPSG